VVAIHASEPAAFTCLLSSVSLIFFFDLLNIFQFPVHRFAVFRVVKPRRMGLELESWFLLRFSAYFFARGFLWHAFLASVLTGFVL